MNISNHFKVTIIRGKVLALSLFLALVFGLGKVESAQMPTPAAPASPRQQQTAPTQPPVQMPVVKSVYFFGLKQTAERLSNVSVTGGQEIRGRVELSGPAPCVWNCGKVTLTGQKSGGLMVQLSTNNPALAKVQPVVLVPTDQTYQDFAFLTAPVTTPTQVTAAAAVQNSPPQSAMFTILSPIMTTFVVDQANVLGGTTVHGAINFTGPPASAGAVKVQLSTTNSAAVTVPTMVALEPNKTVAVFDIPTLGVGQDTMVHVVATLQDRILPAPITIRAAALKVFRAGGFICGYPGQALVSATLTGPAGAQGATIALSSSDPALLPLPATLVIPAQQSEAAVYIPLKQFPSSVTVTGSYQGKNYKSTVYAATKLDLFIKSVSFYDRYGDAISRAQDSEPFKMRVAVSIGDAIGNDVCLWPPPSSLYVSYLSPTGSGTSTGRSFEVAVGSYGGSIDIDLPGLQPGSYHEITLTTDYRKQVDERSESNNTEKVKINGPAAQ